MLTDISFKEVCKFIKEDQPELINDVDNLLGIMLILSPLLILQSSPEAAASALGLLGAKNELINIGKRIFNKITGKKDNDILSKYKRMEVAYCFICYTAFFEALQKLFPKIMTELDLKPNEKFRLSKSASQKVMKQDDVRSSIQLELAGSEFFEKRISLPHPMDDFNTQTNQLINLYQEMTKAFLAFLECIEVWDSLFTRQQEEIREIAESLPELSLKYFKSQYFTLATKYEEFFIWSNLNEHMEIKKYINQMSDNVKKYILLNETQSKSIDFGFAKLREAIKLIPEQIEERQANQVIKELENFYMNSIEKPIIEEKLFSSNDDFFLKFPKKSEIFIPQTFKVIKYSGIEQLEDESLWKELPIRNNLGTFLLSYLSSPYSKVNPLIILGHPGSGKSLLINIISARFISSLYVPIQIILRSLNAEAEISAQIEDQINMITNRKISWPVLANNLKNRSALILLDGYDELLQASGQVFSSYLLKVQKFQENEIAVGRPPVRTIITSRITLINKAIIPKDSVIIQLQEFDETKRKQWISVWNSVNQEYFKKKNLKPFQLPEHDNKIISLAKQPLLLLMLALYDSEDNQLEKIKNMDQTVLYHSLLYRFLERERMKFQYFIDLPQEIRAKEVDKEIERLGVAAIGMCNRRKLDIKERELVDDLAFFKLEKEIKESNGRSLSQADLLLGSFFFVYESKSSYEREGFKDRAFEFLHNTFGEYLAAEFILRRIFDEARSLQSMKKIASLQGDLNRKLQDFNGFSDKWFASLIFTPLYTRPVILQMMRERLNHKLESEKWTRQEFLEELDTIVSTQINLILTSNSLPRIFTNNNVHSFQKLPLMGYIAIYSLNLIILRTILSLEGYTFDENLILPYKNETRPWERLTSIWRSWFSLESLSGLSAILTAMIFPRKIGHSVKLGCIIQPLVFHWASITQC